MDAIVARWQLIEDDEHPDNPLTPMLRDAALVAAIWRLSELILRRDIWM